MNRFVNLVVGFIVVLYPLFAQVTLEKETVTGNLYQLTYVNQGHPVSIQKSGDRQYITFTQSIDASDLHTFPSAELIIALPENSSPDVKIKFLHREPATTQQVSNSPDPMQKPYSVKGYFRIGDRYCMRMTVPLFEYDPVSRQINEIREFRLDIELPAGTLISEKKKAISIPEWIDNKKYSGNWIAIGVQLNNNNTDSWIDYEKNYVKLGVVKDGIYRITFNDLIAYGITPSLIDPSILKIYLKGKQIPIAVKTQSPGLFGADDYIEFLGRRNYGDLQYREASSYGSAYKEYLDRYSDTTIYWLSWEGGIGERVIEQSGVGNPAVDTLKHYDQLLRSERDIYWDFSLSGGDLRRNDPALYENETWNDGTLGVGKASVTFSVSNLYPNKPARAFVKCQDFASSLSTNAHNLAITLNSTGAKYDSGFINKYQVKVLKAEFSSTVLKTGNNTVDINSYTVAGNTVNSIIRDWFELEYPRYLRTTNDSLSFAYYNLSDSTYSVITISGITTDSVSLYKFVIADSSVVKITNFSRVSDTLRFTDSVSNGTYYFLLKESKIPAPIFFYNKKFTNLRDPSNSAGYIAITHPYFKSAATNYVSFVGSAYGVQTKLVDIYDICDEYNYGFWGPEPIREFLKSTHELWQSPKPKHVVLIGKGTYDYYGNKNKYAGVPKVHNFVPPYGNPISDTWFVQWDTTGSLIPQMNIGRLPVTTNDELLAYYSKHQKYVTKGFDDWNKQYLFFAGGNFTDPNQIATTKGINEFIINNYVAPPPIGGSYGHFYKTVNPTTNFGPYEPEYVQEKISNGGVFISYIGHSGTQTWDNTIIDISQLANDRDRNPLITDFGCSTAKYAESDVVSFSEAAVSGLNGQAIGYIGNSSLGFTSTAYTFPQVFYKKLLVDTSATIGDVHRLAKIDFIKTYGSLGSYGLFIKTNTLAGDPIISLPIPTKPNLAVQNSVVSISPDYATDQMENVTVTIPYYNYGSVPDDSVEIRVTVEYLGNSDIRLIKKKIPLYEDSLVITVPVKNLPGAYTVTVQMDPLNAFDEIYENDNLFSYQFVIANSSIRSFIGHQNLTRSSGQLRFLNPTSGISQNNFTVEISSNAGFSPSQSSIVPYDTFSTAFPLDTALNGQRIWMRTRLSDDGGEGLPYSMIVGNKESFLIDDNYAFSTIEKSSIKIINDALVLDTTYVTFVSISGGFNDGNTAVITKNGENYIPENTLRGFHVCLFDRTTFEFIKYYRFDVQTGASVATAFSTFLDTLSTNQLLTVAVANDVASNLSLLSSTLRTSIKQYGSIYIDSVRVADSWSLIGWKGAAPGSVPEKFLKRYNGQTAKVDTTVTIPDTLGSFESPYFSSVYQWNDLRVGYSIIQPDELSLLVIGKSENGNIDTLKNIVAVDSLVSLSDINSVIYPAIKVAGTMRRQPGAQSPTISSIEINYDALPELGTNYQTVRCYLPQKDGPRKGIQPGDTVLQGEKIDVVYRVYNAGGVPVKNVGVILSSQWENNTIEDISSIAIDSLGVRSYKEYTSSYNTSLGFGRRNIRVNIDPDSTVRELYRDNNFFVFPVVVKKNQTSPVLPNLAITQSGIRPQLQRITDEVDSAKFTVIYANTGALVNDSVTISVKHLYLGSAATEWQVRRKYPSTTDTFTVTVPILKRSGEHALQVDLDPVGLITELNETDNDATFYFSVYTTDFRIIQPTAFSLSSADRIIFLNPTSLDSILPLIAQAQIDTLASFTSPVTMTSPMGEFTTEFSINSLLKNRRYYWRVKQLNSVRDWTTGSFYLGDTAAFSIGQVDSAGWMENTFERTSYDNVIGGRIVDTKFDISALSAGFNDGLNGSVELNGINIIAPILGPGHNIAIIDTVTFAVKTLRRFDVSNNAAEVDSLVSFIGTIAAGDIVANVIVDDGANNLTPAARNAFKTIGSARIDQVTFRDSWAIIGRKGAAIGSVPEMYTSQGSGPASADTVIIRKESTGRIVTPVISSYGLLNTMQITSQIPPSLGAVRNRSAARSAIGGEITTRIVGISPTLGIDTVITSVNQSTIPMQSFSVQQYPMMQIVFDLTASSSFASPSISAWSISAAQPVELATSAAGTSISRSSVMEGESIDFTGSVYNLSMENADSVLVRIKTLHSGIESVLKETRFITIAARETVTVSAVFDSKGKKGNLAFMMEIDPGNEIVEVSKENNSVTIPFTVTADSIRPLIAVTIDGLQIVNGDYISQFPEIRIRYSDDNPSMLSQADTSNFKIRLNNSPVYYTPGVAELTGFTSPGTAEIRWTPALTDGENIIQIHAADVTGNSSDTLTLFVNVASKFKLLDVYNIPNPFNRSTHFTFNLAGPVLPEDVTIRIYTVAGRLIQEIQAPAIIGFNRIQWDGRDRDGDEIGNGVYFYRVSVKNQNDVITATSKLVKMK